MGTFGGVSHAVKTPKTTLTVTKFAARMHAPYFAFTPPDECWITLGALAGKGQPRPALGRVRTNPMGHSARTNTPPFTTPSSVTLD